MAAVAFWRKVSSTATADNAVVALADPGVIPTTREGIAMPSDSSSARNAVTGTVFVFLGAAGFSTKSVLAKFAYMHGADALTVLALRMAFAMPFFIVMAAWGEFCVEQRVSRRDFALIAMLGFIGYYLSSYLDFVGLEYVSAGLERLILFLYPTVVVLLSCAIAGRRVTKQEAFALALCYGGAALAFFHETKVEGSNMPLGAGLIAACTVTYAFYLVLGADVVKRAGAARFSAYAMIVASVAVLAHFYIARGATSLHAPVEVLEISLVMALVATVFPVFMMSEGLRRIGASKAAIVSSAGPVITIAMAYAMLNEPVSAPQIGGTALIILGVLAVSGATEKKRQ